MSIKKVSSSYVAANPMLFMILSSASVSNSMKADVFSQFTGLEHSLQSWCPSKNVSKVLLETFLLSPSVYLPKTLKLYLSFAS